MAGIVRSLSGSRLCTVVGSAGLAGLGFAAWKSYTEWFLKPAFFMAAN